MKLKLMFGLFAAVLTWYFLSSFYLPLGFGHTYGFRMYHLNGRYVCRAQYFARQSLEDWQLVNLKKEIGTGKAGWDLVHFRIKDWDWAFKLGEEFCSKRKDYSALRIELQCRTDYGFGDPEVRELKCH